MKHLTPHDRMAERTNWRTISLILESGVFLLMGFQLMGLVGDVIDGGLSVGHAVLIGMAASGADRRAVRLRDPACGVGCGTVRTAAVTCSVAWGTSGNGWTRRLTTRARPRSSDGRDRVEADAQFYTGQMLGWRGGAVIAGPG